jgi:glucan phosphoethanolaminetransferase (alkaline phosphatase superfamily)
MSASYKIISACFLQLRILFFSQRSAYLFIICSYFLLSAVPFIPYFSGEALENSLWVMGIECAAWCAFWAVFKRPKLFHWLLLPAFALLPADLYLYLFYDRGISAHHLGIIFESSPREMAEFLGGKLWLVFAATLLFIAWWWVIRRATLRTDYLDWTGISRKFALITLSVLAVIWVYEQALPSWTQIPFERVKFADTRPFGFFATASDYWTERQKLSDLSIQNHAFIFGAHQAHPDKKPLVIVMVIGESSRYDRWSLNGYARETNPLLKKEANLISASDVIVSASATLLSVPVMLTRKRAIQSFQTGFTEKSFISAFKEAGFKTYWLSNQIPFGKFDTPVSVYAKEADVVQFVNLDGDYDISSLDEILFDPLNNALKDNEPKKLIILHTLGNHWNYSRRYSPKFDRWQPSLSSIEDPDHTDSELKVEINNSYDNSVLYTDWFLSQIVDTLKSSGYMSAMLYISDHGENLHDGTCDLALHGHNTIYDFKVPMIVWYSSLYKSAYPNKIEQLKHHKNAKLSAENIFHSLLDMGDIRYGAQQLEWSFFSSKLKPHKRYVDSYGWSDYDNSTIEEDCHEVMDKGTPLPINAGQI